MTTAVEKVARAMWGGPTLELSTHPFDERQNDTILHIAEIAIAAYEAHLAEEGMVIVLKSEVVRNNESLEIISQQQKVITAWSK